ncbi:ABC transporter, partial [Mesorhizobium sp. M00.F.Ca.ET.186.01.1.1]
LVASGTPDEVLEPGLIRDVFGVETEVITHPRTGKKHVYFFSEALRNEQSRQEVKAL